MLTVTEAALERLSRKLERKQAADDMTLRLKRAEGRWRLRLDRPRLDDEAFTHHGKRVLVLDESAAREMTTLTLDVLQTSTGPRLRLSRNADRKH